MTTKRKCWKCGARPEGDRHLVEHQPTPVDLSVSNHGSIYLLSYGTEKGRLWLHEHIDVEHSQTLGTAVVVEARYIVDIVRGALDAGLVVR